MTLAKATAAPALEPSKAGELSLFVLTLALTLAASLGSFTENLLQDTFKSIVVSLGVMLAGVVLFTKASKRPPVLTWHIALLLPLLLAAYAVYSMTWSHAYLAGVEAARWLVLAALMGLVINTYQPQRAVLLVTGIYLGAASAALWAMLQFWFNFGLFPQGPNPASTFVNRNFLAEFLVSALPYGVLLLLQTPRWRDAVLLTMTNAGIVLALLMTGTRSAMLALALLGLALPWAAYRPRAQTQWPLWSARQKLTLLALALAVVLGLGAIGSNNPQINAEVKGADKVSALQRSLHRIGLMTQAHEYQEGSFSVRIKLWQSTARMIAAHPVQGVGAGAWEVQTPLYQDPDSELELDYYAHNEYLQLVAEYGWAAWVFLLGLALFMGRAGVQVWRQTSQAPLLRSTVLLSTLALLLVSAAGFPWRMAMTGALLAVNLGLLCATDGAPLGASGVRLRGQSQLGRVGTGAWALAFGLGSVLAAYVSWQAVLCERKITTAVAMALYISASNKAPDDPGWGRAHEDIVQTMREGVAINPHYRKITAILPDELATWDDWKNALWMWESLAESRPYVAAIRANIVRAHLHLNQPDQARAALAIAQQLQPHARSVRLVTMVYLYRTQQDDAALLSAGQLLHDDVVDGDVTLAAYDLAMTHHQWDMALLAMQRRRQHLPLFNVDSWLKTAKVYEKMGQPDPALDAYRQALAQTPAAYKAQVSEQVPAPYRARL